MEGVNTYDEYLKKVEDNTLSRRDFRKLMSEVNRFIEDYIAYYFGNKDNIHISELMKSEASLVNSFKGLPKSFKDKIMGFIDNIKNYMSSYNSYKKGLENNSDNVSTLKKNYAEAFALIPFEYSYLLSDLNKEIKNLENPVDLDDDKSRAIKEFEKVEEQLEDLKNDLDLKYDQKYPNEYSKEDLDALKELNNKYNKLFNSLPQEYKDSIQYIDIIFDEKDLDKAPAGLDNASSFKADFDNFMYNLAKQKKKNEKQEELYNQLRDFSKTEEECSKVLKFYNEIMYPGVEYNEYDDKAKKVVSEYINEYANKYNALPNEARSSVSILNEVRELSPEFMELFEGEEVVLTTPVPGPDSAAGVSGNSHGGGTGGDDEIVTVKFKNGFRDIPNYDNIVIRKGTIIHGPLIDPVPLNKKGKPKRLTAKKLVAWVDQDNNVVDLSKPIEKNLILTAVYKIDKKKVAMIGAGAAVGGLAFVSDLLIPTPIPVVSMAGTMGFTMGGRMQGKRLVNLCNEVKEEAMEISAVDEIPDELKEKMEKAKKGKYLRTFLRTARIACNISMAVHSVKGIIDSAAAKTASASSNAPAPSGASNTSSTVTNYTPPNAPATTGHSVSTDVLGSYHGGGNVYGTAADAVKGVNGLSPDLSAFNGGYTYQAFYNGHYFPVHSGQSIQSILSTTGATDPSQVAVRVMNSAGGDLTWESLGRLAETVTKIVK